MFDIITEHFEREQILKLTQAAEGVRRNRRLSMMYQAVFLIAGILSFTIIILGKIVEKYSDYYGGRVEIAADLTAAIVLIFCSIGRVNARNVVRLVKAFDTFAVRCVISINRDFLWLHSLAAKLFTIVFLIFIACYTIYQHKAGVRFYGDVKDYNSIVDKFLTAAFSILGLQVGILNFLFGQLLGKYSSTVVQTVVSHPAVKWVRNLALLNLFVPIVAYAEPVGWMGQYLLVGLIISNLFCFILTLGIAKIGIEADRAITYSAFHISRQIFKAIKTPISPSKHILFWTFLRALALDWRDHRRFIALGEPSNSVFVEDKLTVFLGIAGKAIQDNQRDILIVTMSAITRLMHAYTQRRSLYYSSSDRVFSYLNDQLAVLLRATGDQKNEYLVADLVKHIGTLGRYTLYLGSMPSDPAYADQERAARQSKSHSLASSWIGLLREAFDQTFNLMRSTAANECIDQIRDLAIFAFHKEWPGVLVTAFLPAIEKIHLRCAVNLDAYRQLLAAKCIRAVLLVWVHNALKPSEFRSRYDFHHRASELLERMGKAQMLMPAPSTLDFNQFGTVLTKKLDDGVPVIQDVFFAILTRDYTKDWERRAALDDLSQIINLTVKLGEEAIVRTVSSPDDFSEALYDLSYLILKGLSISLTSVEPPDSNFPYQRRSHPIQQSCDVAVFTAVGKLFKKFCSTENWIGSDWKQYFFGTIGLAISAYRKRGGDHLRAKVLAFIKDYFVYVQNLDANPDERVSDNEFDYLQLAGAWVSAFLDENALASEIAKFVAERRPFHDGLPGGVSGRYAWMGYPSILHTDFFIPVPRGLSSHLTQEDQLNLEGAQSLLVCDEVMIPYYELVEQIRKPLRRAAFRRIRLRREQAEERARQRKRETPLDPTFQEDDDEILFGGDTDMDDPEVPEDDDFTNNI